MTSFVHVDQPTEHPGVRRAEILFGQIQAARAGAHGARPLIALFALFAGSVRKSSLATLWREAADRRAQARADARFLATAQSDPRIMQELQAAVWRQQSDDVVSVEAVAKVDALARMNRRSQEVRMPTLYEAMRRMNSSRYY